MAKYIEIDTAIETALLLLEEGEDEQTLAYNAALVAFIKNMENVPAADIPRWIPVTEGGMNLKELLKQSVDNEDLLPELPQENKDKNTEIVKAYKEGYEQGKKDAERHGKWIDAECYSEGCDDGYICSECRRITYRTMTAYCPNCGAKMEE